MWGTSVVNFDVFQLWFSSQQLKYYSENGGMNGTCRKGMWSGMSGLDGCLHGLNLMRMGLHSVLGRDCGVFFFFRPEDGCECAKTLSKLEGEIFGFIYIFTKAKVLLCMSTLRYNIYFRTQAVFFIFWPESRMTLEKTVTISSSISNNSVYDKHSLIK